MATTPRLTCSLFLFLLTIPVATAAAGSTIFGVTIDDPWTDQTAIYNALAAHAVRPTTRVVFDEQVPATEYLAPVENIHQVSHVMGEILDSYYVASYSVNDYLARTAEYLDTLQDRVDIWEIGNEVNGDWLGTTADVKAKIEGAYTLAVDRGVTTAVNFYYNKACSHDAPDHEMFTWIRANISDTMKDGLDYVFFSYYEDDCGGVSYSREEWQEVFEELHTIFPHAQLGFGETGTENNAKKADYIQRYYGLAIDLPYYVGGYFWWYYKQDCVPKTQPLWNVLETTVNQTLTPNQGASLPAIQLLLFNQ